MLELKEQIEKFFSGDVVIDSEDLKNHSRDWSLFEIMPKMVVYPRNSRDIEELVRFTEKKKRTKKWSDLSLTARAAGTDMSGGPLNDGIIIDVTKYMKGILSISEKEVTLLPGTYYRDLEIETDKLGVMMPCFPASKNIAAIGGMVANNGAGEKTLKYGQNKNWVTRLKVILFDGNEYVVEPLTKAQLEAKILEKTFEGELYHKIWHLITRNKEEIEAGKPKVSKNSSGYLIWDVWDEASQTFDLTKLFVGAQGTTGIITEVTYKLTPKLSKSKMIVIFTRSLAPIPLIVQNILPTNPAELEVYDDNTFKFAKKFFNDFVKNRGWKDTIIFGLKFIPEILVTIFFGKPKLIILAQYEESDTQKLNDSIKKAKQGLKNIKKIFYRIVGEGEQEKYWQIRHDSFKLLTEHTKDMSHNSRTAPFVDDIVIKPEFLPDYLSHLTRILDENEIMYTIAGHLGNGNLHVIPIMDFDDPETKEKILAITPRVYRLVESFEGSLTGEHNDGIIRTPYLYMMFNQKMMEIFKEIKVACDPLNIFNPRKKVGGTKEDIARYMRK